MPSTWEFKVSKGFARLVRGKRSVVAKYCRVEGAPQFRKRRNPKPGESEWYPPTFNSTSFFDPDDNTFPAGYLERIIEKLESSGIETKVRSYKSKIKRFPPDDYCFEETVRKHQRNAIRKCLKHKFATIEVATGGGKTLIMATIAAWLVREYGMRVLVMVPTKNILNQNFKKFKTYIGDDVSIGRVGDRYREYDCQITIGIVNSLHNGVPLEIEHATHVERTIGNRDVHRLLQKQDCIIEDECHGAGAATWFWTAIEAKAQYYYGFSGTVETGDPLKDARREAAFGPMRYQVPAHSLIKKGYLAKPKIYMLMDDAIYEELPTNWEYRDVYYEGIVRNLKYNNFISRLVQELVKGNRQIIVNVRRRSQGLLIRRLLLKRGIRSKYVDGRTSSGEVENIQREFVARQLHVIVATRVFDVGVDLPLADALVMAGGEKAHIGLRQRIGRVLRPKKHGGGAIIFDFSHDAHFFLIRHAWQRCHVYAGEDFEVVSVMSKRDLLQIAKRREEYNAA